MRTFVLFELFLVLFAFYTIAYYEGWIKLVVSVLCLAIAFLFERVRRRRRYYRYSTRLKAQYSLKGDDWNKCTVNTIARKGMRIIFNAQEIINVGSTIHFSINVPGEEEPVTIDDILRWIRQNKSDFVGGIEFPRILETDTFVKLSLRYSWEHE
jgi:hypothetical protein